MCCPFHSHAALHVVLFSHQINFCRLLNGIKPHTVKRINRLPTAMAGMVSLSLPPSTTPPSPLPVYYYTSLPPSLYTTTHPCILIHLPPVYTPVYYYTSSLYTTTPPPCIPLHLLPVYYYTFPSVYHYTSLPPCILLHLPPPCILLHIPPPSLYTTTHPCILIHLPPVYTPVYYYMLFYLDVNRLFSLSI